MGKTVLLHEFGRVAVKRGFVHEHIEVHDGGQLPLQLAVALRKALLKLGGKKKTKGVNRRALGVLKAFTLAHPVAASLQSDAEVVPGVADSGDLGSDLEGLFGEVGGAARAHEAGVFLTIDEMHQLPSAGLDALLLGLHRTNETGPSLCGGRRRPALAGCGQRGGQGPRRADVPVPPHRGAGTGRVQHRPVGSGRSGGRELEGRRREHGSSR